MLEPLANKTDNRQQDISPVYLKVIKLVVLFLFAFPALAAKPDVVFVYTGEMLEIAAPQGDYAQLATLVQETRMKHPNSLFLFGGSSLGPSVLSAFDNGSHIIDILNTLEPDVMAVASREFSYFEDELSLRSYEAGFPMVASNLLDPAIDDILEGIVKRVMLQSGRFKIGVIAVLAEDVERQYALERADITPPVEAIKQQATLLRAEGADAVVLMYSSDMPEVDQLIDDGTVDVSLRKDDHFLLANNIITARTQNVFLPKPGLAAVVALTFNAAGKPTVSSEVVRLRDYAREPQVWRQINDYSQRLNKLLDHKLGITMTALDTRRQSIRTQENAFANFIADAVKQKLAVDVVLLNSGSIRGEQQFQPQQVITRRHIAKELPFKSHVLTTEATGAQLLQALEHGFSDYHQIKGRFPVLSGMTVVFNSDLPSGQRVLEVKIGSERLNAAKTYHIATLDYLAHGGDGYNLPPPPQGQNLSAMSWLLSDIVIGAIQRQPQIAPVLDNRLSNKGEAIVIGQ